MATTNYDKQKAIAHENCVLYRVFLQDRTIFVLKFDEIFVRMRATRIGHKNVLKLIRCCLKTKIPTLVYEYVD